MQEQELGWSRDCQGALPPEPRVEGIREGHDRAGDVTNDHRSDIGRVQDRRVSTTRGRGDRMMTGVSVLVLILVAIISVAALSFSVILSRHQRQIDRLIEENAIMGAELRELRSDLDVGKVERSDGVQEPERTAVRER